MNLMLQEIQAQTTERMLCSGWKNFKKQGMMAIVGLQELFEMKGI